MAANAGELRHRVTIQSYVKGSRDDDGYDLPSEWIDYKKAYAKITPLSTKDLLSAQAAESEITARMKVRYSAGLDIDTTMRVVWKGRLYAIDSQGLDDSDSGLEYTTFTLSGGIEQFKD
jgi:SPP1 family predicted phage head-tail adaptor